MEIDIDHVAMPVGDIERSVEFYQRVFGAKADGLEKWRAGKWPVVSLSFGRNRFNLHPPDNKITLKANPLIAMAPARVVLTAELVGGDNDFEEFYCPAIEWEWGDGTKSESSGDCAPYEAGKSEIKRRFTVEHVFRVGAYRVMFHLKRHDKSVGVATVNIQVRPGLRDGLH